MEEKKKGKSMSIMVSIMFLVIIILTVIVSLMARKILDNNMGSDTKESIKLDESLDYVYDASYKLDNIIIPYVNIDSDDAKEVNQELYSLYEELVNDELKNKTVNYDSYINDDVLSIVVTVSGTNETYTYKFDLDTGNVLD